MGRLGSDDLAVGAQNLAANPGSFQASQERDGRGDVFRLPKAFQWRKSRELVDDRLGLPIEAHGGRFATSSPS